MSNAGFQLERQACAELDRPVVEVVLLALHDASKESFKGVMHSAIDHLRRAPGYLAHSFGPCAEDHQMYVLLVWWRSLDAHVLEFRGSEEHALWRLLLQAHLQSEPWVRHFEVSEGIGQL